MTCLEFMSQTVPMSFWSLWFVGVVSFALGAFVTSLSRRLTRR